MQFIVKLEEAAMFVLATTILFYMNLPWWIYMMLLLGPDISMLGYLGGNKAGAISYNIFHHKGIAIVVATFGYVYSSQVLLAAGVLIIGHASLDRMFGYGLKYFTGFSFTHLGNVGKEKQTRQDIRTRL